MRVLRSASCLCFEMAFIKWQFRRVRCGVRAIKLQSAAVQKQKLYYKKKCHFSKAILAVHHVSVSGNARQATCTNAANFTNKTNFGCCQYVMTGGEQKTWIRNMLFSHYDSSIVAVVAIATIFFFGQMTSAQHPCSPEDSEQQWWHFFLYFFFFFIYVTSNFFALPNWHHQ